MSIYWIQAAMGLTFVLVCLISGQIIVRDRGARARCLRPEAAIVPPPKSAAAIPAGSAAPRAA